MNTVDSTRRALELCRQQIARRVESSGLSGIRVATDSPSGAPAVGAAQTVRRSALQRLRALSPAELAHESKAIRAFVEAVLAAEYGAGLTNSADYQEMLGVVCSQIQADAQLALSFKDMIRHLLIDG